MLVLLILLDLSHGHCRVQSLIYEFLLIPVFQKRPSVILQFLLHILFVLGQFFLCDIYEHHLRCPTVNVLQSKTGAVLRRCGIRNIIFNIRFIQLMAAHFCYDLAIMYK